MSVVIYTLCALAALACAILLVRSYARTRTRLLLWGAVCFSCLTINSVILICDLMLVQDADLFLLRNLTALLGIASLLYALIWEAK